MAYTAAVMPSGISYIAIYCILYTLLLCTHIRMHRFVPDLEDIVEFGEMVQKAEMSPEAITAAKYI